MKAVISLTQPGTKKIGLMGYGKMGKQLVQLHESLGINSAILVRSTSNFEYLQLNSDFSMFTTNLQELMNCDVVIDMLPENLELKTQILREFQSEGFLGLICTSTSTFTLSNFKMHGIHLTNFSLLHFSNPIHAFKIVEVSNGGLLDNRLLSIREDYLKAIDRIGVEVPDSRGFIINRLFFSYLREALIMHCCEGVDRDVIDRVMIGGTGQKMGPFEVVTLIGRRTTKLVLLSLYGKIEKEVLNFLDESD